MRKESRDSKEKRLWLLAMFLCGFGVGFAVCLLMPAILELLSL